MSELFIGFIFIVGMMVALSLIQFHQARKLKAMKARCTVSVPAECTYVDVRRQNRHWSCNARYSFEYMGQRCRGSNNVWGTKRFGTIKPGEKTELLINPDCLPDDVFDPIAEDALHHASVGAVLCLVGIIPLVMPIIFIYAAPYIMPLLSH